MLGFGVGLTGIIGAIMGILACVASSILMCCAPKSADEGAGKFTAAMAMLLIAGIVQIICGIAVIAWMVTELNKNNKSYCDKLYVECKDGKDSDGTVCADGFYGSDAMCQKDCIDADHCAWGGDPDRTHCAFRSSYDSCKASPLDDDVQDAISGIIIVVGGIAAAFLFIAGILNTLGGFYCFKAKTAMAGPKAIAPSN